MGSLYYLHHLRSCAVATSGPRPGNGTGSSDHGGGDGGGGLGDPVDALLWVSIFATMAGVALAEFIRGAPPIPPAASVELSAGSSHFARWRANAHFNASREADARAKEERAAAKKAEVGEDHATPDAVDAAPNMQVHRGTPIPAGVGIPRVGIIVTMTGVALAWGAGHETIRGTGAYILKTPGRMAHCRNRGGPRYRPPVGISPPRAPRPHLDHHLLV